MGGKNLTKEEESIIKDLLSQGVPKTVIAKKIGRSTTAIYNFLNRLECLEEEKDDMIGKTFGQLTVLRRAEKNENLKSRCIRYVCECSCGKIVEVNGNSLRTGHTKSCGCSRKNHFLDISNNIFGYLTAIEPVGSNEEGRELWKCKCKCGTEIIVTCHDLTQGHTKSCGCLRSWKEKQIEDWLKNNGINYKRQYTFKDLRGIRNPLRFDFALLNNAEKIICLIEYQGQQHYDINNNWNTKQLEESDKMKREYCHKNNIDLYELNKDSDIEEKLERICNIHGIKLSRDN